VCVCLCVYVCVCVYLFLCVRVCVHAYKYTHVRTHNLHSCTHIHCTSAVSMVERFANMCVCVCSFVCVSARACVRARTCIHACTCASFEVKATWRNRSRDKPLPNSNTQKSAVCRVYTATSKKPFKGCATAATGTPCTYAASSLPASRRAQRCLPVCVWHATIRHQQL